MGSHVPNSQEKDLGDRVQEAAVTSRV